MPNRISPGKTADDSKNAAEMKTANQSASQAGTSSQDDLRQLARVLYLVLKQRQGRSV